MIECTLNADGTFAIAGLTAEQLATIEEGIIMQFNATSKDAHKPHRRYLLGIVRPITSALDVDERRKEIEKINLKLNL